MFRELLNLINKNRGAVLKSQGVILIMLAAVVFYGVWGIWGLVVLAVTLYIANS